MSIGISKFKSSSRHIRKISSTKITEVAPSKVKVVETASKGTIDTQISKKNEFRVGMQKKYDPFRKPLQYQGDELKKKHAAQGFFECNQQKWRGQRCTMKRENR